MIEKRITQFRKRGTLALASSTTISAISQTLSEKNLYLESY